MVDKCQKQWYPKQAFSEMIKLLKQIKQKQQNKNLQKSLKKLLTNIWKFDIIYELSASGWKKQTAEKINFKK